jgi:PKD repeat protein/predicted RNA-binding Zn-ribbon protein involved in translation (DUF1610 family)
MNKFCGAVLLSVLLIITVPLSLNMNKPQQLHDALAGGGSLIIEGDNNETQFFDSLSITVKTKLNPAYLGVGDFNNDGLNDIVIASRTEKTLEVYLQSPGKSFDNWPNKTIILPYAPSGMAVGDLDGDSIDDIAVTSATAPLANAIYLLFQKYEFNTNITKSARLNPYGIVIADFDGDGRNDFAVANRRVRDYQNCSFVIYYYDQDEKDFVSGNDHFIDPDGLYAATEIAVANIIGDNKPEIAVADSTWNKVAIYRNDISSPGIDGTWLRLQLLNITNPSELYFTQIDMTGPDELVILSKSEGKIFLYRFDASLQRLALWKTKSSLTAAVSSAMLDLNNDLIQDLIVASGNTNRAESFVTNNGTYGLTPNLVFPCNGAPFKLVAHDMNHDGLADLLISANATSINGSVTIYYRQGNGFMSNANGNAFLQDGDRPSILISGDFDGDGHIEIGALVSGGLLRFVSNDSQIKGTKITGISPFHVMSSELTDDSYTDIVVSNYASNNLTLYYGGGDFFRSASITRQLNTSFPEPKGIGLYDISGDSRTDIVVACTNGIQIFYNTGVFPYFDESHCLNISIPDGDFTHIVAGDFNVGTERSNGWPQTMDIAVVNGSFKIEIYFQQQGAVAFSPAFRQILNPVPSSSILWLGVGQINDDDLKDIIALVANDKSVLYLQKEEFDLGFENDWRIDGTSENGVSNASIGDLDDDGRDEIAIIGNLVGIVTIYKPTLSSFIPLGSFSAGAGPGNLLIADVNKDFRKDLLISSSLSNSISINYQKNLPPHAVAICASSPPLKEGTTITFDGSNSTDSYSDLASLNYTWSFGDGHGAYGKLTSHVYMNNGNYQVSLKVTDRGGLVRYSNLSVVIYDASPVASFTVSPTTIFEGSAVNFTDTSTSYPDPIVTRRWEFGDGAVDQGNNGSTRHTYIKNGTYHINLTVTDKDGSTSSYSYFLVVLDNAPMAAFEVSSTSPMENTTVYFTDKSTSYPDAIVSWYWDFGDNSTSDKRNPTHTYLQNGTYLVSLTVRDVDGSTNSSSATIQVRDSIPSVSFSFNPTSLSEGQQISFLDKSTAYDGIVSWLWDFGDGLSSSERNPIHIYTNNGTFMVRLIVVDGDGSIGSYEKEIRVEDTTPNIIKMSAYSKSSQFVEDAEITIEVTVTPSWESTKNFRYWWDFNYSGSFSMDQITQINKSMHSFSKKGTYVIAVQVWDSDSYAEESITIEIMNVKPSAEFSYQLVQSGEMRFDASLSEDTPSDMSALKYRWNFNDGSGWSDWNNSPVIFHLFENDGNYSVVLEVMDDDRAVGSFTLWVVVDREVPIVGNIVVSESIVGKPIIIRASINDNVGIRNATLFYKVGSVTFSTTMLKAEGPGTIWEGQIGALNATTIITFWIEAIDTSGNKFTTGQWEILVTEGAISTSLWIAGLGVSGLVLGGAYLYMRRFSTVVDEVFVIYEDGCLIAHDTRRLKPGMDDDVLSSMLIAIQDFVKTTFKDENTTALKRLDFGEKKILVEKGEKVYLAAVLHGKYDAKITQKMLRILNEIQRDYGSVFAQWDGDLEKVRGVRDKAHLLFEKDWKVSIELFKSIGKRLSLKRAPKIECPICGEEISSSIGRCPSCGSELHFASISELEEVAKEITERDKTSIIKSEGIDQNENTTERYE